MRFSRDKRGYENTFVVHGERRRGRGRSRLLYWFRTPPGVKVGRAALDEEAIRLLEELNPEVEFDWTRILKGDSSPAVESRPLPGYGRRSSDRPRPAGRRGWGGEVQGPRKDEPSTDRPPEAVERRIEETLVPDDLPSADLQAQQATAASPTPAHARLGSEGLSRLRGRYAEILARITERVQDPTRREELKSLAERLNPDSWVTDDEVKAGLEEYEEVFESVRAVVGRRKRRRRRGARAGAPDTREGQAALGALEESTPGAGAQGEEAAEPTEAEPTEEDPDSHDI